MEQEIDIKACRMLLHEIGELCDHASLTGSLSGGAQRTAQRFNSVLDRLTKGGVVPAGLFVSINEDATYGEIGVEARMLGSYCRNDEKSRRREESDTDRGVLMRLAPFVRKEELGLLIREHRGKGMSVDMHTLTNLAPFLGQDILSDLLREHLAKASERNDEQPAQTAQPSPPEARPNPQPVARANPPERPNLTLAPVPPAPVAQPHVEVEDHEEEDEEPPEENLSDLLNLLKSPYLSEEERNDLIEKIRKVAG